MNAMEKNAADAAARALTAPGSETMETVSGRLDLAAIVTVLLGICSLGLVAGVIAVIEVGRLILALWQDSLDRWLLIALAAAVVWLIARRKKLCVM